jgi:biopolymer transport protein ExbD
MELKQTDKPRNLISLVPMIDVMLIMLIFFMVTSTYLNLDMIPVFQRSDDSSATPSNQNENSNNDTMLVRLSADGKAYYLGRSINNDELSQLISNQLSKFPSTNILLFPSNHTQTQSLVTLMDTITKAGGTRLRIIRLEDKE